LSDPGHKIIDAYGLHDPAYDGKRFDGIPHPAAGSLCDRQKRPRRLGQGRVRL